MERYHGSLSELLLPDDEDGDAQNTDDQHRDDRSGLPLRDDSSGEREGNEDESEDSDELLK